MRIAKFLYNVHWNNVTKGNKFTCCFCCIKHNISYIYMLKELQTIKIRCHLFENNFHLARAQRCGKICLKDFIKTPLK